MTTHVQYLTATGNSSQWQTCMCCDVLSLHLIESWNGLLVTIFLTSLTGLQHWQQWHSNHSTRVGSRNNPSVKAQCQSVDHWSFTESDLKMLPVPDFTLNLWQCGQFWKPICRSPLYAKCYGYIMKTCTLPDTVFRKASPFSYTGETVEWSIKSGAEVEGARPQQSLSVTICMADTDFTDLTVSASSLSQQLIELDQCRSPLTALARDSSLLPLPPPSPIYYFSPCRYRVLVEMFCAGTGPYLPVKTDIIIMPD